MPGQHGGYIAICTAITQNGVLHLQANLVPHNTALILTFFSRLHNIIIAANQTDQMQYICHLGQCVFPLIFSKTGFIAILDLQSNTFHHIPPWWWWLIQLHYVWVFAANPECITQAVQWSCAAGFDVFWMLLEHNFVRLMDTSSFVFLVMCILELA